jgi:hypothetical protein
VHNVARDLAGRLRKEAPGDARAQIGRAWRILFGREPKEQDVASSLAYLAEQSESIRAYQAKQPPPKDAAAAPAPDPALDALGSLCQVLFSSNRFLYVE